MNRRLELKQLVLLYFLLCICPCGPAWAANLNIQNASNKGKPDQFTLDTIQINSLIQTGKSVILSNPVKSTNYRTKALNMASAIHWESGLVKGYSLPGNAYWCKIEYEKAYEYFSKTSELAAKIKDLPNQIKIPLV